MATTAAEVLGSKVMRWLHAPKYVVFAARDTLSLVLRGTDRRDKALARQINGLTGWMSNQWIERLVTDLKPGLTRFEWLLVGPARKSIPPLEVQAAKIAFLRGIGADRMSLDLPNAEVTRLARRVSLRKASNLERIAEAQRTIELACFVTHRLEVLTDGAIGLFNHLVNDIAPRSGPRNPHRGTAGISFADAGRAV